MNGLAMEVQMLTQAVITSFASFSAPSQVAAVLLYCEWQAYFIKKN